LVQLEQDLVHNSRLSCGNKTMADPVEPLILDLLEWIGPHPRLYAEVMEAWRTSCPRLPVWEEANQRGFIEHLHGQGQAARVAVSALGRAQLAALRA
jgi:D-3-phosphoglycerate dehydrogenase